MRVHLIRKETIEAFVQRNARSKSSFLVWLAKLKYADWQIPEDMKQTFGSVDFLSSASERVVFNIGGNNYRMICKYHFGKNQVHLFICWIGTHDAYTSLCNKSDQFTITEY
jgi:mRNA interferase HigB